MRTRLISAAGLAAGGIIVARRLARGEEEAIAAEMLAPGPVLELRGEPMRLPIAFHRSDGFAAILGADLERIAAILPSDRIHPVRLDRRRAAVFVGAYRHHEAVTVMADGETRVARPYGEVFVAPLVTPRPAPPVLPLLAMATFRVGAFVLHLPVTSRLAMDAGRLWNYPKFVADMDFVDDPVERAVTVADGGLRILTLRVRSAGRMAIDRSPTVLYSERNGQLLETAMPTVEVHRLQLGRTGSALDLGDHAIADALRGLALEGEPFVTMTVLATRFAMPAGRAVGPARPYRGYPGVARDFGRYTVRHAGTPAIDQYAGLTPDEWTTEPGGQPVASAPGAQARAQDRDRVPLATGR